MKPIHRTISARSGAFQFGFKTSIITLFVAIVLVIGLTLVYLSFSRITAVTDSAASKFIDEVAELSADRIGSQLGRGGVVAGDLLLGVTEELLKRERLTPSGVAFLFDDDDRILAHPQMSELLGREVSGLGSGSIPHLRETDMAGVLKAIRDWRNSGVSEQFFLDPAGRRYAAAFQTIPHSGPANLRVAIVAPVDEFFANILSERGRLFAATIGFVAAMVPIVFFIGSLLSKSLRALAEETDRIQRFEPSTAPPVHSIIREIDELGRSVSTMRAVTQTFSRFVPRRLVEKLIETGTPLQLGGARREVTLFFSDVVNFTEITEKADPAKVMQYTSRYFAAMSQEIMSHSGTVDKFIGDAIMAIWNAPADDADHAANACAAALAFQRANHRLNVEFGREGWPAYRTRCGLHTGEAVVGNIGSEDRMNYTALGATVNLAARLEGLNKNYGTSILVSSALQQRVASRFLFRSVDRISPKGFAEAFEIYELKCAHENDDAENSNLCREWELVYAALRNGPLAVAETELAAFLAKYPEDGVARYHQQCRAPISVVTPSSAPRRFDIR
ncbi:MAG: adenylate cyclase [Bradyrhizobium sp.]|jgi:adenylate cyclase|nr:adenylate cyclase [Bradyrhizobium sp.]